MTFLLDVSKLLLAQGTQHCANLILAYKTGEKNGLECEWYIINLMLDATIGVLFQYFYLTALQAALKGTRFEFDSGNYGDKEFKCSMYAYQMALWEFVVISVYSILYRPNLQI